MGEGLSRAQRRQIESVLDRIEDRLLDAPTGLHAVGGPADPGHLDSSPLSEEGRLLWARWDGLELLHGEVVLYEAKAIAGHTREAAAEQLVGDGDVVLGERGRQLLVACADPWEEGADVVVVDEDGERSPFASTVGLLVLGLLGEASVLYDEDGEFREELFDDELDQLTEAAERRLLRRRLDFDPDAPLARYRLAQLLRRSGETRASISELGAVIKRAPSFVWARFELGRAQLSVDKRDAARREFEAAAAGASDEGMRGLFFAWAALASEGEDKRRLASAALEAYPGIVAAHEGGAREALELEEPDRARELVEVGLAVLPGHLGLLDLQRKL